MKRSVMLNPLRFVFLIQILGTQVFCQSTDIENAKVTTAPAPIECDYVSVLWYSDNYEHSPTVYDRKLGKCVIKIGSMCNPGGEHICPTNARCPGVSAGSFRAVFGYCTCVEGFSNDDRNGLCGKVVGYGDSCQIDDETGDARFCDIKTGSDCLNGTCQCSSQEYDERRKQCKPAVGERCYTAYSGMAKLDCPKRSSCKYGDPVYKCECDDGYLQTDDGKCLGNAGNKCDAGNPCFNTLECMDNQCVCPQALNQIFDAERKTCLNLVGAKCDKSTGTDCVEFSECGSSSKCSCKDGYAETLERTCISKKGDQGGTCDSRTSCNSQKGLACVKGKCQCVDPTLDYDDWIGCAAAKWGRCGWMNPPSGAKCKDGTKDCTSYYISCGRFGECESHSKGYWYCS